MFVKYAGRIPLGRAEIYPLNDYDIIYRKFLCETFAYPYKATSGECGAFESTFPLVAATYSERLIAAEIFSRITVPVVNAM